MGTEVAKYQFQSWARKGIAAFINEQDTLGNSGAPLPVGERASVPIGVSINAAPQTPKNFALIGPGDIIGIHLDMIVRTDPRNWITNVEPNYLAFIEFYDEDFPWRYTPAKPTGDHLRPWIFLLVLKEGEFDRDDHILPLPALTVKTKDAFPRSDETWLFAHVHTERDIAPGETSDLERYLKSLQAATTADPDKIYSRLLSPRHLEPNQPYHAFLVPSFEAGRLSGLGRPTKDVPAQKPAWDAATTSLELPIYYSWYFRTGERQDFESLVELLKPHELPVEVGVRPMDCSNPGFVQVDSNGLETVKNLPAADPPEQKLEGALRTKETLSDPLVFAPNEFQDHLQILVNLPETIEIDLQTEPGTDDELLNDPVVTVPFYGKNHARQKKTDKILLDVTKAGWYHDLNRDPRTRVPAGLGTSVIQKHQEKFMQRAWKQVHTVYEANKKIRNHRFFMSVSMRFHSLYMSQLEPPKLLAITSPLHSKILGSATTVRHQISESRLAAPVFSAAMRRLVRPAGKLALALKTSDKPFDYSTLVTDVNSGRVTPAGPFEVPRGLPSVDQLAERIQPNMRSTWLRMLVGYRFLILLVLLLAALLIGLLAGAWIIAAVVALGSIAAVYWLNQQGGRFDSASALINPELQLAALREVRARPAFNVELDDDTTPLPATPGPDPAVDSVEAHNFRKAAMDLETRLVIRKPKAPQLLAYKIDRGYRTVSAAIHPNRAFPARLSAFVKIPDRSFEKAEDVVDAMAHPDFEDAMYKYLRDIDKELLIPNLDLIPPDTISLLETNPKFIEAYMVGLNHEMGRELLWREYPTDLRGSCFRQFWEVKGISSPNANNAEQLKDITKIHGWQKNDELGTHKPMPPANADVPPGQKHVVLVIRGELLKRYPNTVIYAQKAIPDDRGNNVIREKDPTPDEFKKEFKFPLFKAEIDPDLRFFGFDLTIKKASGEDPSNEFPPTDKRGWFFVIQEVPGEPRFGMDIDYSEPEKGSFDNWNSLAWDRFGATEPAFVQRNPGPTFDFPGSDLYDHPWAENSAQMAYILFQVPAMVAVHASEMLP